MPDAERRTLTVQYNVTLPSGRAVLCADKASADRLCAYLNGLPATALRPAPRRPAPRKPAAKKGAA